MHGVANDITYACCLGCIFLIGSFFLWLVLLHHHFHCCAVMLSCIFAWSWRVNSLWSIIAWSKYKRILVCCKNWILFCLCAFWGFWEHDFHSPGTTSIIKLHAYGLLVMMRLASCLAHIFVFPKHFRLVVYGAFRAVYGLDLF